MRRRSPRIAVVMPHLAVVALIGVGSGLLPGRARAGGFTITVVGGRRTGMMANMGAPDDLTALFHNPAGLADQPGVRLHVSGSVTLLDTAFKMKALDPTRWPEINAPDCGAGNNPCWPVGSDGYYEADLGPTSAFGALPYLGASTDLSAFGKAWKDVVVSAAVYLPNFFGGSFNDRAPTRYHITDGYFLVAAASAGAGWRINDYISVGATLSYNFMQFKFAQRLGIIDTLTPAGGQPDAVAIAAQGLVGDLMLDYTGIDHGLGWVIGALVRPTRWLSVGVSYNGSTEGLFSGDPEITAPDQKLDNSELRRLLAIGAVGLKLPTRLEVEMPIPPALFMGVNVHPTWWLELAVDLRIWFYTVFKRQVLRPIYDPAEADLEAPLTEESLSRDKHYDLSYELNGGVLIRPLKNYRALELMWGIGVDKSPIPDETFTLDNPSLDQLASTAGVRLLYEHWRLSATYMLTFHLKRNVTTSQTSPPTNAYGSGVAHMPGIEAEYVF